MKRLEKMSLRSHELIGEEADRVEKLVITCQGKDRLVVMIMVELKKERRWN